MWALKRTSLLFSIFIIFFSEPALARKDGQITNITILDASLRDANRNRDIGYRLYTADPIPSPAPVVIFSHGLGGSIASAPYLAQTLARDGYMAFFLQHPGSDADVYEMTTDPNEIKDALRQAKRARKNTIQRFQDISFVIDELEKLNYRGAPLEDMMDLDNIIIAGHGLGAHTALMAIGEKNMLGEAKYKDPRIKAAILLSPEPPDGYAQRPSDEVIKLYNEITVPTLHITGNIDEDPLRTAYDPKTRLIPYRHISAPDKYLLVFDGADYATFEASTYMYAKQTDIYYHDMIGEAVSFFLKTHIEKDKIAERDFKYGWGRNLGSRHYFEYP